MRPPGDSCTWSRLRLYGAFAARPALPNTVCKWIAPFLVSHRHGAVLCIPYYDRDWPAIYLQHCIFRGSSARREFSASPLQRVSGALNCSFRRRTELLDADLTFLLPCRVSPLDRPLCRDFWRPAPQWSWRLRWRCMMVFRFSPLEESPSSAACMQNPSEQAPQV